MILSTQHNHHHYSLFFYIFRLFEESIYVFTLECFTCISEHKLTIQTVQARKSSRRTRATAREACRQANPPPPAHPSHIQPQGRARPSQREETRRFFALKNAMACQKLSNKLGTVRKLGRLELG